MHLVLSAGDESRALPRILLRRRPAHRPMSDRLALLLSRRSGQHSWVTGRGVGLAGRRFQ